MRKFILLSTMLCLATMFISSSCHEKDPLDPTPIDPESTIKDYLRKEYMDVYYYWYKDVKARNAKIDPTPYDIYDYFDALLYSKDRWSWMMDKDSYISDETGVVSGTYGASFSQPIEYYGDYSIVARYVYPNSPFAQYGVSRGWIMTHINGVEVMTLIRNNTFNSEFAKSPQTFTFKDLNGKSQTFTATAATALSTRSYLYAKVFRPSEFEGLTEPVGYFNYLAFKATMLDDITSAMETIGDAGVKKLILDLRYNGGGDSRASQLLIDYLAPKSADGEVYVVRKHNDLLASQDVTSKISRNPKALDLDKLYIITGSGTASASEMILNGLRPLMDVQNVGDTTYGKPNGMYVLFYPGDNSSYSKYNKGDYSSLQYVFLPICFYNQNKLGENIPENGFIPVNYRADDVYHNFGVEEDLIKACLTHIVTGKYPSLPAKTKASASSGKKISLTDEENNPHYGLYTVTNK